MPTITFSGSTLWTGPDQAYGFQQAQGGPPDDTAESMMRTLATRIQGIKANNTNP